MKPLLIALTAASLFAPLAACQSPAATPELHRPAPHTAAALPLSGAGLLPQYPSLSPDGSFLVFSWAGDLWAARLDWTGGRAAVRSTLRLTAHPAYERRSAFSPDGASLAFESDRDGARNLYVMPLRWSDTPGDDWLAAGAPRRITYSDAAQTLGGFTSDGAALLYSAGQEPTLYRQARMYRAPLDNGPVSRLTDAYGFLPRPSADGTAVVFSRGYASALDRSAYRGPGNTDLYRLTLADGTFTRLTSNLANDAEGFQTADGSVVYLSSRDGQYNVYRLSASATDAAKPAALTSFTVPAGESTIGHGVHDLAMNAAGNRAVFLVWDTLYALDLTAANATPSPLTLPITADSTLLDTQRLSLDKNISEAVLSPDGKTLAVVARGEVFVRSTEEGRPTRRVTETAGRERDLAWSPDGRVLYFSSDESGVYALYAATVKLSLEQLEPKKTPAVEAPKAEPEKQPEEGEKKPEDAPSKDEKKDKKPDFGKKWAESLLFDVVPLLPQSPLDQRSPVPSPDGKSLLYTRGLGDLVLVDLEPMSQRVLFEGWDEPEAIWAPDSRHIIYSVSDLDYNNDLWLMDVGGSDGVGGRVNLTQHPDNDFAPRLSADGKVLVFLSERAGQNGEYDAWQVYLDKKLEGLKPYELDEYYKKAAEAAGKRKPLGMAEKKEPAEPLTIDAQDAYLRVRRVTSSNVSGLAITPGADRILFSATIDAERTLYSVDRKGEDRKVIQAGAVGGLGMSLTGDKATYIRSGAAYTAPPKGGKAESLPIDAPVVLDVAAQQRQKFMEAARILGTRFYNLKGLDWGALTERYLQLAQRTRTNEEFDRVVELLFGELNGSHTGINSGSSYSTTRPSIGQLGATVEPGTEGYTVTGVLAGSPADQEGSRLKVGDVITGIDGRRLSAMKPMPDLSQLLLGKAGKETLLEVRREGEPEARFVLIVPVSSGSLNDTWYQEEVKRRRAIVDDLSGGTLGYLHIRSMGDASVRDFERDLYAAANDKKGLIIDVRDNGGGYTTDILLASLTAPVHARTYPRGVDPEKSPRDAYPRDRRLIYAYTRPINVLINENSFSNAEVFAHAIQNIKRGTLVGTATFGGVISTGAATLLDGSTVRVPGRGWIMPDGLDMESNGAVPEVDVPMTPADETAGRDPQLEAAVRELMGRSDVK